MSGIFIHPKSGNVGIGLTNPRTALEVNGTITASNISVIGDFVRLNTVTSNTEQMVIENAGTGPALKVTQTGANSIAEFYDDGNVLALKIADGGNVGIGVTNPSNKFSINSGAIVLQSQMQVSHGTNDWGVVIKRNANDTGTANFAFVKSRGENPTPLVQGDGIGRIAFHTVINDGTSQQVAEIACKNYNYNGTNADGGINFATKDITGTLTSKFDILPNGNVGIGTILPFAKLHIQGDVYYTGSILRNGQTKPFARYCAPTNTSGRMNFATKTHDTHNAVTIGSSWKFTVPSNCSGYYIVAVALHFQGTNLAELYKVVGGVATIYCRIVQQSVQYMSNGSTTIYLNAGEDIYINSQAISNTVDIYNYIDIACLEIRAA